MSPRVQRQRPEAQSPLVRRPEAIRTAAETPEASAAPATPATYGQTAAPPRSLPAEDAGLDDETLNRWRWQLGATARRAAATRARADSAMAAWERLVDDAKRAGVPGRLVVAAAADAGIDTPL